ncbi:MAG: DUF6232 family protein, partial [Cyanobacteria bacterium J06626_18]
MAEEIIEEKVDLNNLEKPNEILISDNALTFENTVYQIRNISSVTVRKWKIVKKDVMPLYQLAAWLFIGALIFTSSEEARVRLMGVMVSAPGFIF